MRRGRFLITGIIISGFLNLYLYSQQIDPFYLRLLQQGEESFRSRNYMDAATELEIAAFGLYPEKRLLGKACVYLSLCHYYLNNMDESEKYLRKAAKLGGKEGLGGLELEVDEPVLAELLKLSDYFQLDLGLTEEMAQVEKQTETEKQIEPVEAKEKRKEAAATAKAPPPPEIERESTEDLIKELEKKIEKEPTDTSLYYRLYELHRKNDDFKAARKTLQRLVKKNPEEIEAYYLWGKLSLERRNYKDAGKAFERIVDLSSKVQVEESTMTEAKASLVLCSYLRGDRKKAQKLAFSWMNELSPEKISSLSLDAEYRQKLQKIVETYRAQAEMEKEKARIKKLEAGIKRKPQEISFYYELYEIYRKRREMKPARKVIENLVKNNPDEMSGVFLLAKIEFLQKRYKDALKGFRRILAPSERRAKRPADREMVLRAMVYACLCSLHLKKEENLKTYLENLRNSASEQDILRIVKEEGLEEEWTNLIKGDMIPISSLF